MTPHTSDLVRFQSAAESILTRGDTEEIARAHALVLILEGKIIKARKKLEN